MNTVKEPIAIIGLSSLFPAAENLQQFWGNIFHGNDAITDVPESHWKLEDYYDPDPSAEDKTYCRRGGFLPHTRFSPIEFGIPPNALDVIDILQLLSLNVAKSALHNAGYLEPQAFSKLKERTGVVLGITGANSLTQPLSNRLQYPKIKKVLASRGLNDAQVDDIVDTLKKAYAPWEENSFPGMLGNVVAGRIANRFDLGGVNCTVDAACASSMAALRMALDELQCGRADMMLTGGCDAENTILMYLCFSKTPAFSRRGIISPFDVESDGTLIGEGMGMLALKRLSDAERDGDRIYAVIKGLGASSDGKFKSIYAPRKEGQMKCLSRAYADAGFPIRKVGLLEAHGTGTKVGDATEVGALKEVIGPSEFPHIALGSVKSQIGHTKAAAGAAGLIKVALSLYHKALPPSINVKQPSKELRDPASPLYLNNSIRPWLLNYGSAIRRAGISAFGFGGTNFHAVLEEYQGMEGVDRRRLHTTAQPVVVKADSAAALRARLQELSRLEDTEHPWPFEAGGGQGHRLGFVAGSLDQLREKAGIAAEHLTRHEDSPNWQHPKGIYFSRVGTSGRVAALFSGQGSQYVNMARSATLAYPPYMALLETADRLMHDSAGEYLSDKIYPRPSYDNDTAKRQEHILRQTQYAQPAIGCISAGAYQTLSRAGFQADCVAGHSFGELTALWAAGALQTEEYMHLAIARGCAMAPREDQVDSGTMAAVSAQGEAVERLIKESGVKSVYLCNFNTDEQTAIGGGVNAVAEFGRFLDRRGINFTPLPVSAAFHTPLVAHAQKSFAESVDAVNFRSPVLPLYRNRDGQATRDAEVLKTGLKQQLLEPVRFVDTVRQMLADGVRTFVEFGPKGHLSKMVESLCEKVDFPVTVIALDNGKPEDSAEKLNSALVQLAVAGVAVNSLEEFEPDYRDAPQKPGFAVELNGINYVSDNRRQAWQKSLAQPDDAWNTAELPHATVAQVPHTETSEPVTEQPQPVAQPTRELTIVSEQKPNTEITTNTAAAASAKVDVKNQVGAQLELLGELMRGNSGVHQTYLAQVSQTSRQTVSLLENLNNSYRTDPHRFQSVSDLARQGLQIVADGQAHSSDSHRQFLQQTVELASLASGRGTENAHLLSRVAPLQVPDVPEAMPDVPETMPEDVLPVAAAASQTSSFTDIETPVPRQENEESALAPQAQVGISSEQVCEVLMRVVSEKTGYPQDVLSPEMDMEADLGIDSIKRVEILGDMHKALPGLTQLQPEALTEVRSLQDIIDIAGREIGQPQISSTVDPTSNVSLGDTRASAGIRGEQITEIFLQIVSEKTGYPSDVLDMSMNLEADLGIDSIKRVEILGELQKTLNLSGPLDPAALGELGTLGDIANYIEQAASGDAPAGSEAAATERPATEGAAALDAQAVAETLLTLVSEKTGYPRDVIELEMDLEADLGIDSIKRVEILGGLQSHFPDLPAPSPEAAGELRQLQQILDFLGNAGGAAQSAAAPTADITASEAPAVTAIRRHNVGLRQLGPVDQLLNCYRPGARVLLVNSDCEQTLAVTGELERAGLDVYILSLPNAGNGILGDHIALDGWTEQALVDALNQIPEVDAVVYQHPPVNTAIDDIGDRHDEVRALKHLLLLAKHYKCHLDAAGEGRRAFVTLARMDGRLGLAEPGLGALAAGCFGLVKTLAVETEHLFCRAVDIDPALEHKQVAQRLLAELHDHNINLTDVGVTAETRYTLNVTEAPAVSAAQPLPEDTCFVVTGGARGITAECIQALAERQPGRYLLLGRTPFDGEEPGWARGVADADLKATAAAHLKDNEGKATPKAINELVNRVQGYREIRDTLKRLEQCGASGRYAAVDISDAEAVRAWAESDDWLRDSNSLALVHGAGALADKRIEDKQMAEVKRVFSVKLYGLANLLSHLDVSKLKLTCVFSSVAGLFGNVGQVDYAMANEILNRMTLALQPQTAANGRTLSVIWGAWNAGMVTPAIKKMFESRGIALIEVGEGAAHFAELCQSGGVEPLIMVGPSGGLSTRQTAFRELCNFHSEVLLGTKALSASKLLSHHAIGGEVVLPATFAMGWVANVLENCFAGVVVTGCERMNVNKGLVLTQELPERLLLAIDARGADGDEHLTLDAVIRNPANGQVHYSYQGIELSRDLTSNHQDSIAIELNRDNGGELYRDQTLFHGDDFQLLKSYQQTDEREMLFTCQWLPQDEQHLVDGHSTRAFCPMYADALLQAALVWVKKYEGLPSLPMEIEDLRCHQTIERGETLCIRVGLVEQSDSQSTLYLSALKRNGQVHLAMKAAVVKSAALAEKFAVETASVQ